MGDGGPGRAGCSGDGRGERTGLGMAEAFLAERARVVLADIDPAAIGLGESRLSV